MNFNSIKDFLDFINQGIDEFESENGFHFDGPISKEEFANQLLFVIAKDIIMDSASRKSISEIVNDEYSDAPGTVTDAAVRSKYNKANRVISRVKEDRDSIGVSASDTYLPVLMTGSETRKGHKYGRKYNAYDNAAFELCTELEIIPILTDLITKTDANGVEIEAPKVADSKKTPGKKISEAYVQFSRKLIEWGNESDPENWLFHLFNLAGVETRINASLTFRIAEYMVKEKEKLPPSKIHILCGPVFLYNQTCAESRFLFSRQKLIPYFFQQESEESTYKYMQQLLKAHGMIREYLISQNPRIDQIPSSEWKLHFESHYNLFDTLQTSTENENCFTPKLIKAIRSVIKCRKDWGLGEHEFNEDLVRGNYPSHSALASIP